jgi:hypothetical protein
MIPSAGHLQEKYVFNNTFYTDMLKQIGQDITKRAIKKHSNYETSLFGEQCHFTNQIANYLKVLGYSTTVIHKENPRHDVINIYWTNKLSM